MAMNLTQQMGSLSETQLTSETTTGSSSSTTITPISSVWNNTITPSLKRKITPSVVENLTDTLSPPVSPCRTRLRPDLTAAYQAFTTITESELTAAEESECKVLGFQSTRNKDEKGVPVYVMMPLDSVKMDNSVNRRKAMNASLQALKSAGVEGIMMDVWWGLVERDNPGEYNWGGYMELLEMAKKYGLKVQAVMSFHQCGGNVGDSVT